MKFDQDNSRSSFFRIIQRVIFFTISIIAAYFSFKEYVHRQRPVSGLTAVVASALPIKVAVLEGAGSVSYRELRSYAKLDDQVTYDQALTLAAIKETFDGFIEILPAFTMTEFIDGNDKIVNLSNLWLSIKDSDLPQTYDYDPRFEEIKTLEHFIQDIGINFTSVARQYSELDSAFNGGYLGEISVEDLPDNALVDFYEGDAKYSEILSGRDYFYLAMRGDEGEGGVEIYLIGIEKAGMKEYLRSYAKEHRVIIY